MGPERTEGRGYMTVKAERHRYETRKTELQRHKYRLEHKPKQTQKLG